MTKTQLASRADLSRTTVHEAVRDGAPPASAETVAALSRALGLSEEEQHELLELRRRAVAESVPAGPRGSGPAVGAGPGPGSDAGPGRPIDEWDPHALEVHPAGTAAAPGARDGRVLSAYVRRAHDTVLARTVATAERGRSGMVVLVGSSSTGKTRACWEAVQPLAAAGWRLWHPYDPTRAEAALADLQRVRPRTVVWLNEAQHYLGDAQVGERIAAALHTLLTEPCRAPVLVLGTLWPEYADRYTVIPASAQDPDPHSRVRELLAARTLTIPECFDDTALAAAEVLAEGGDRLLADALTRTRSHGRLAQDLAGAPELLRRYETGTPPVRALIEAAMDARRLGVGLHLPHRFLVDAAADYLTDQDWDDLTEDWAEAAFADLARRVHGKQAPLRRSGSRPARRSPGRPDSAPGSAPGSAPAEGPAAATAAGPLFVLADYLEQYGRTARRRIFPPASFWYAADAHLTRPEDLNNLAGAAHRRYRRQWARHLDRRALDAGHVPDLFDLALQREREGDWGGADSLFRQAAEAGERRAARELIRMLVRVGDSEGAEKAALRAAEGGEPGALTEFAEHRERAGDRDGADASYRRAVAAGDRLAVYRLVRLLEEAGDRTEAEAVALRAAEDGDPGDVTTLARKRELAGDRESAEVLYRRAVDAGDIKAVLMLARMWEKSGALEGAEELYWQAAEAGSSHAVVMLVRLRERAGDRDGAEAIVRQAVDVRHPGALAGLAGYRERSGDREAAKVLYRHAVDAGHRDAQGELVRLWEETGEHAEAEAFALRAVEEGRVRPVYALVRARQWRKDREGAKGFLLRAVEVGHSKSLIGLAELLESMGEPRRAEVLYRRAADADHDRALVALAELREKAGDREGVRALHREAADIGVEGVQIGPYGLDLAGDPITGES
ncbi:hypothetical protein ACFQ6N_18300 [Kitasatospora sp. NPDC056446]|uniref:hypothetical protein n=1 Tax=Kitasatospora sp. NPDC056446 TaxID=3345819 RepID=UPI003693D8F8